MLVGISWTPVDIDIAGSGEGDTPYIAGGNINTNFTNIVAVVDKLQIGYDGQRLTTTAAYELVLADAGFMVDRDYATACTLLIPENASVPFPVNTRIDLNQGGAGLLTVSIEGTDTLLGDPVSQGQHKSMSLWKKSATVWVIYGGTTA